LIDSLLDIWGRMRERQLNLGDA